VSRARTKLFHRTECHNLTGDSCAGCSSCYVCRNCSTGDFLYDAEVTLVAVNTEGTCLTSVRFSIMTNFLFILLI